MLNIPMIINIAGHVLNAGMNGYSIAGNRKRRKENKAINERLEKLETAYKTDMGNIQKDLDGIANGMKDMNTKLDNLSTCVNGMGYDLNKLQSDTVILQGRLDILSQNQSQVQQSQVQQSQVQQPQHSSN